MGGLLPPDIDDAGSPLDPADAAGHEIFTGVARAARQDLARRLGHSAE